MGKGCVNYDLASSRYLVDLSIVANYDAVNQGHDIRWQRSTEWVSELLFNATGGTMQLGTIYFENDGIPTEDHDIILHNASGDCFTTEIKIEPFCGQVNLFVHAMNEPLCHLHELGHYLATLGDEYWGRSKTCQNDPATGECIMEFARGYGIQLNEAGELASTQPADQVTRFCDIHHPNTPRPFPTNNGQQSRHRQSCWATIKRLYPNVAGSANTPTTNTLNSLQWLEASKTVQLGLAIGASDYLSTPQAGQAIKIAVKEWIQRVAASGDQFALIWMPDTVIHAMGPVSDEDVANLQRDVDRLELSEQAPSDKLIPRAIEQFTAKIVTHQRVVLIEEGQRSTDGQRLSRELITKRLTLSAITLGLGELAERLDELARSNKWIKQHNLPIAATDAATFAFTLQNELITSYFTGSPGYGLTELRWGSLPGTASFGLQPALTPLSDTEEGEAEVSDQLSLQLGFDGFDFPLWIEQGADSISILLSEPEQSRIALQLIAPDGKSTAPVAQRPGQPVQTFDQANPISGRWIVRLRRLSVPESHERLKGRSERLPFYLLAAVKNSKLRTALNISVSSESVSSESVSLENVWLENKVHFRLQVIYTFPVDYVTATVEIHQLAPDESPLGTPIRSTILSRQRGPEPGERQTELSSGIYQAEVDLPAGSYTAIVRVSHHGQALYAANPDGVFGGHHFDQAQRPIPPFHRLIKQRFRVPGQDS